MQYFTGITLGTPGQPFRAMIDISWSDLFVPSSRCKPYDGPVCSGHFAYHASWSRTYAPNNRQLIVAYPGTLVGLGEITNDTLVIAGLEIKDQQFMEGVRLRSNPFLWWIEALDAVLGLGPDDDSSWAGIRSPLANMISRQLLHRNIMSLRLPRNTPATGYLAGELAFGGINEDLIAPNASIRWLAPSNKTDPPELRFRLLNSTWRVPARSVSVSHFNTTTGHNETVRVELKSPDGQPGTARFDTVIPMLFLPQPIVELLARIAKPSYVPFFFPLMDCGDIQLLPDIVFELGDGDVFAIPPRDYIWSPGFGCVFTPTQSNDIFANETVVLGSPFLRGFYTVFDLDTRYIGFAKTVWSYI